MTTTADIAKKYKKEHDEVKAALAEVGYEKRITVASKVTPDIEAKLDAYFREKTKAAKNASKPAQSTGDRRIGQTQIVERKKRSFTRPDKPTIKRKTATSETATTKPTPSATPSAQTAEVKEVVTDSVKESVKVTKDAQTNAQTDSVTDSVTKKPVADVADKTVAPATPTTPTKSESETVETTETKPATVTKPAEGKTLLDRQIEKQRDAEKKSAQLQAEAIADKPKSKSMVSKILDKLTGTKKDEAPSPIKSESKPESKESKGEAVGKGDKKRKTISIDQKVIRERREERMRKQRSSAIRRTTIVNQHGFVQPTAPTERPLPLPETISVKQLSAMMSVKAAAVINKLVEYGSERTAPDAVLDRETASVVAEEFGYIPTEMIAEKSPEQELELPPIPESEKISRPPVVTIMGHVDHGKTSLLDYIRKTRVAAGEAGGITQHIGAYQVKVNGGAITFLDTPGHALFTQMRARGAKVTDIVVLVVAGDDGVKPQTIEAISHAQAADVPIVVAVNKMDKAGADLKAVQNELSARGVLPEEWGGDAIVVPISAHTGDGVDKLLEAIRTQSEILDLKASQKTAARAVVVEASINKGRGVVGTVIVQQGILRRGDYFVCGAQSGRLRAMWDSSGNMLKEASPSTPVEIQGLSGMPESGEALAVVDNERKAREIATLRHTRQRSERLDAHAPSRSVADMLDSHEKAELNVIVKADVGGSQEALSAALSATGGKRASIKVIHTGVGGVSESDINLAHASRGVIVAFNVQADSKMRKLAQSYGVKILYGKVIYEIIDNAEQMLLDLLGADREEKIIGSAEVLQVFSIAKVGNIAGCRVSDGIIRADVRARLLRDGTKVYEGDIDSLRHFKEQTSEVRIGDECGIAIRRCSDIQVGDVIEAVQIIETPPVL